MHNKNDGTQLPRVDRVPQLSLRSFPPHRSRGSSLQGVMEEKFETSKITEFISAQRAWSQQINKVIMNLAATVSARSPSSPRVDLTTTH